MPFDASGVAAVAEYASQLADDQKKLSTRFDYKSRAGAFLLGLKKPVLKGHGSCDEKQMYSCIKMMHEALANNIFDIINKEITSNNIKNE